MKNALAVRCGRLLAIGLVTGLLLALWLLIARAAPAQGADFEDRTDLIEARWQPSHPGSLLWIENVGQFDADGRFLLRHGLGQTWLTGGPTIWLSALDQEAMAGVRPTAGGDRRADGEVTVVDLKLTFVGANPNPKIEAAQGRSARVSYFRGDNPGGWFREVPVWGAVRYRDLYPGVNLVFSAGPDGMAQPALPWWLEVEAGADLGAVRLRVEGAAALEVAHGLMTLDTEAGRLSLPLLGITSLESGQRDPAAEASAAEVAQLSGQAFLISAPFASAEAIAGENATGLEYSTYLGGSSWDWAYGVEIDAVGAAYVAGVTPSTDFPTVPGSYKTTLDAQDAFVAKVAPDGSHLEYATFLGGSVSDSVYGLTVIDGEVYVTGETWSGDFPTTVGAYDRTCGTDGACDEWTDAFLVRLNASGNDLLYATYLGGKDEDSGNAVEVLSGEAYLVGYTLSEDFPTTSGAYDRKCGVDGVCDPYQGVPTADAFLAKLSTDGNGVVDLLYATFLGGSEADEAKDVAVSGGDAYLTGDSSSPDFLADGYADGDDAFVVRIEPSGGGAADLIYGTFLGGSDTDRGYGIAVVGGAAAVTGETRSGDFLAMGDGYNGGINDAFVAMLDGGGEVTYAAFLGGDDRDHGRAIALDGSGAMIVAGYTQSLSDTFPVTTGAYDPIQNGGRDAFVARIFLESNRPQHITYASYLGGMQDEEAFGVTVDESGSAYLIGYTRSVTDFPVTEGAFSTAYNGGTRDGFISKLKVGGPPGLTVEKSVNGIDADDPPGPYFSVGEPLTWTYVVANIGGSDLSDVIVTDDQLGTICQEGQLLSGESFSCSRNGTAEAGQYVNVAMVTGQPDGGLDPVSDVDLSHYFGAEPGISLVKLTNGQEADSPPGPTIRAGTVVTWAYVVTNTGNVTLRDIAVTDTVEGPAVCEVTSLAANQSMNCVLTDTASSGVYSNTATVVGIPPGGLALVSDEDDGYYFGATPSLTITKYINGQIAREAPGLYLLEGDTVTWSYDITNTGNVPLTVTGVVDDHGLTVSCPRPDLTVDDSMTCEVSGQAEEGAHADVAVVTALASVGPEVVAGDIGHYFGVRLEVDFQKRTNGVDADDPPGFFATVYDPITWTFHLTSASNVSLGVEVHDNQEGEVICEDGTLDPAESITCTATGVAGSGPYTNTGILTLTLPGDLSPLVQSDASHYFGMEPAILFEKRTNGQDPGSPRDLYLVAGSPVQWTYHVTNSGNVTLTQIVVVDDLEEEVPCPKESLAPGEPMICVASGEAIVGAYNNQGTVTATLPSGQSLGASDTSSYFGIQPEISIQKLTYDPQSSSFVDAGEPPGPTILEGEPITWTYVITNSGDITLTQIALEDDPEGVVMCPETSLAPQITMTCELTGVAVAGQYANSGVVRGTHPAGGTVSGSDLSHYFGFALQPAIDVHKTTNDLHVNRPPGPRIIEGGLVRWEYLISNVGNVRLEEISLTDDRVGPIDCLETQLDAGESFTCSAEGLAEAGQYTNTATVTGSGSTLTSTVLVSDTDVSYYFGTAPSVALTKLTNGADADGPPGPSIGVGEPVTWTYLIWNTGNVVLSGIRVVDDNGTAGDPGDDLEISCEFDLLDVGESKSCELADIAIEGQYSNIATVTASYEGVVVEAVDGSHYRGGVYQVYLPLILR